MCTRNYRSRSLLEGWLASLPLGLEGHTWNPERSRLMHHEQEENSNGEHWYQNCSDYFFLFKRRSVHAWWNRISGLPSWKCQGLVGMKQKRRNILSSCSPENSWWWEIAELLQNVDRRCRARNDQLRAPSTLARLDSLPKPVDVTLALHFQHMQAHLT